jgi:5-methylcytosine-specific restriction endonuclease McrA
MSDYPAEQECPKCGHLCHFNPRPDTQHWGSIRCPNHGFFWIPKPSEDKKLGQRSNKDLAPLIPAEFRGFCWKCRRTEEHLKALRPSVELQVHHIIEVNEGGTNDLINLQRLCRECHAEVHRKREQFARYVTS